MGAERFFLYDNGSTDEHWDVLRPYLEDGVVIVHDWPSRERPQEPAFNDCLKRYGPESRWIAFIDLDEYLFSPTLEPLTEILPEYEQHPGVVASWVMFGTSGHETKPPGLTIENFIWRKDYPPGTIEQVKSIVDPSRTSFAMSGHQFTYLEGDPVNERHEVKEEGRSAREISMERLRVHHYAHRSREEYLQKLARPQVVGTYKKFAPGSLEKRITRLNAVRDDTITAYVPELRERLAAVEARDQRLRAKTS